MSIQRYDYNYACDGESGRCRERLATVERGDWVLYDDHLAALTAERERADRAEADAEMGRRWRGDSSLETWFPYTAEELARTKAERDALRERVARLEAALDKIESDTYDTSIQAIARTALEDK